MFLVSNKKIEYFKISKCNLFDDNILLDFRSNLFSLRFFECNAFINSRHFTSLSKYCKNIKHLIINSYNYDNPGLA